MSRIRPVLLGQQEHGADAAGSEALDAIGQFVVDVGGGHHGEIALESQPIPKVLVNSPLAFLEFLADIGSHSKAPFVWRISSVF